MPSGRGLGARNIVLKRVEIEACKSASRQASRADVISAGHPAKVDVKPSGSSTRLRNSGAQAWYWCVFPLSFKRLSTRLQRSDPASNGRQAHQDRRVYGHYLGRLSDIGGPILVA